METLAQLHWWTSKEQSKRKTTGKKTTTAKEPRVHTDKPINRDAECQFRRWVRRRRRRMRGRYSPRFRPSFGGEAGAPRMTSTCASSLIFVLCWPIPVRGADARIFVPSRRSFRLLLLLYILLLRICVVLCCVLSPTNDSSSFLSLSSRCSATHPALEALARAIGGRT